MSEGVFSRVLYEMDAANGGFVGPIRVQPETLQANINSTTNVASDGTVNMPGSIKVSKTRREIGVGARSVTLAWDGAPPTGYSGDNVTIPCMRPATFAFWTVGSTGTYLGANVVVVGRSPETVA